MQMNDKFLMPDVLTPFGIGHWPIRLRSGPILSLSKDLDLICHLDFVI